MIGSACWELFCIEHGISPDGMKFKETDTADQVLFEEHINGKYVPRCLMVDLEPEIIEKVCLNGKQKELFDIDYMDFGEEDAKSICYEAKFGRRDETMINLVRKMAEKCDNLDGINLVHSVSGGTGSGKGSQLLERCSVDFGKKSKFAYTVHPGMAGTRENIMVAPYNAIHGMSDLCEHSDLTVLFQNQALYDICSKDLKVDQPNFININNMIAQSLSSMLAPLRLRGPQTLASIDDLITNLVPYPRIHFVLPSFAKFTPEDSYPTSGEASLADLM